VTKKDIVKTIAADADLTQLKVKEIVQRTFDEIIETLARDGKIELRNFGVFRVRKRAARPARNPRTDDEVWVPEKCVVTFKPGKEMQARIRDLPDVPGGFIEVEASMAVPQGTPGSSSIVPHAPEPLASTPLPGTVAPAQVSPAKPPTSEMAANETKSSLNQLTGE